MLKLLKKKEEKDNKDQENRKGLKKTSSNSSYILRGSRGNGIGNETVDFGNFEGIFILGLDGRFRGFPFIVNLRLEIYAACFLCIN